MVVRTGAVVAGTVAAVEGHTQAVSGSPVAVEVGGHHFRSCVATTVPRRYDSSVLRHHDHAVVPTRLDEYLRALASRRTDWGTKS